MDKDGIYLFCYELSVFAQECKERFNLGETQFVESCYAFYSDYHGPKNYRDCFGEDEFPYIHHFLFDELCRLNK